MDKIPAETIKKAWPYIGNAVCSQFFLCLDEGWHPTPFHTAILCTIRKAGKQDKAHPCSYRLIALLLVLGKGLEKAIARRLAWEAIKRHILPPGYCRALPLRSAPDLACLLTDNIQQAFSQGMVLSMVTFDVQGGFDTVLSNRLLQRLIEQQWPTNLISWVQSFLSQRSASIQLGGIKEQPFPLTGSLPQGSPAFPILFMLYLKLLFAAPKTLSTLQRKGYADNSRISAKSITLTRNCQLLEQEFQAVRQWCQEEQIPLNFKKTNLMHFSRKRNNDNPSMQVLPTLSKTIIGS